MKTIQQIAKEFQEVVKGNLYNSHDFIFYNAISGFYNDKYFDVYFRVTKNSKQIEISENTRNVEEIASIIKKIEPLEEITTIISKITYETVKL